MGDYLLDTNVHLGNLPSSSKLPLWDALERLQQMQNNEITGDGTYLISFYQKVMETKPSLL